jgi:hypothetical protein
MLLKIKIQSRGRETPGGVFTYCGRCHGEGTFAVGIACVARSRRQYEQIYLPLAIHHDEIIHDRIDVAACDFRWESLPW